MVEGELCACWIYDDGPDAALVEHAVVELRRIYPGIIQVPWVSKTQAE